MAGGAWGSSAKVGVCAAVGVGGVACAAVGSVAGGYAGRVAGEKLINMSTARRTVWRCSNDSYLCWRRDRHSRSGRCCMCSRGVSDWRAYGKHRRRSSNQQSDRIVQAVTGEGQRHMMSLSVLAPHSY